MSVEVSENSSITSRLFNSLQNWSFASQSLPTFETHWNQIHTDLVHSHDTGELDEATASVAFSIASTVEDVCQVLKDMHIAAASMETDIDQFLASHEPDQAATVLSTNTARSGNSHPFIPEYIEPAYRWLLNNLHNPYPSHHYRDTLSNQSGSRRPDIDAWFTDVRRRIGWNALRKARFLTRKEMIDAATRFFVAPDPKRRLEADIEAEFAKVKLMAMDMYTDKLDNSNLAIKLAGAVKDMTPELKVLAKEDMRRRKLEKKAANAAAASYPSPRSPSGTPEPSISPVPIPTLPHEENDLEPSIEPPVNRKRRAESSERDDDVPARRSSKRSRSDDAGDTTSVPSPSSTYHEDGHDVDASEEPPTTPSTSESRTRKRRLSESDGQGPPKRFRGQHIGPLLRSVSDPTSLTSIPDLEPSSFYSWFQEVFDTNATLFETPDPLDVSLFDYAALSPASSNQSLTPEPLTPVNPQVLLADISEFSGATVTENPLVQLDQAEFSFSALQPGAAGDTDFSKEWTLVTSLEQQQTKETPISSLPSNPHPDNLLSNDTHILDSFLQSFGAPQSLAPELTYNDPKVANSASYTTYDAPFDLFHYQYLTPQGILDAGAPSTLPPLNPLSMAFAPTMYFESQYTPALYEQQEKIRKLQEMKEHVRQLEQEVAIGGLA